MTRTRYRIEPGPEAYFLTSTVVAWLPVFSDPQVAKILLDSWTFLQEHGRITLYGYVILENHAHWLASGKELAKEVGDFKSFTARKIIDYLEATGRKSVLQQLHWFREQHKADRDYQLWQEGSHPEQIQSHEMSIQKLDYIHMNPVKRGYVDDPVHWRYSSARNYAGMQGLIPVTIDW
jgi:putative transposase